MCRPHSGAGFHPVDRKLTEDAPDTRHTRTQTTILSSNHTIIFGDTMWITNETARLPVRTQLHSFGDADTCGCACVVHVVCHPIINPIQMLNIFILASVRAIASCKRMLCATYYVCASVPLTLTLLNNSWLEPRLGFTAILNLMMSTRGVRTTMTCLEENGSKKCMSCVVVGGVRRFRVMNRHRSLLQNRFPLHND